MKPSKQAIRILSEVAGELNSNFKLRFRSFRAEIIASFMAKNIVEAKNNGGSPTPFK